MYLYSNLFFVCPLIIVCGAVRWSEFVQLFFIHVCIIDVVEGSITLPRIFNCTAYNNVCIRLSHPCVSLWQILKTLCLWHSSERTLPFLNQSSRLLMLLNYLMYTDYLMVCQCHSWWSEIFPSGRVGGYDIWAYSTKHQLWVVVSIQRSLIQGTCSLIGLRSSCIGIVNAVYRYEVPPRSFYRPITGYNLI